ncbi:TonB-dependent siderophore receptor [Chromohalobacter canadensis]|uniref:TonB-dependent siderophore receptor n=1 Tax=Chromohalobacter canadensis TaxID=141389 RepID=UPI0021BE85FB|nr:TonB-dependent siderophore receptor [Chromohalobacter canadensis]MCT8467518.1 TonB-dependent siderophore receptor [Chromohalobacter canadensis]MCT8470734.1 TonB-dependent siderophore receptor [Chromohalobacter canadensis]MCT8498015.1 TonB-dependent siderophore receptor [Chromohalobacter canadensis]
MSRSLSPSLPINVLSSSARRLAMATLLLSCPLAAQAQDNAAQSDTVVVTATALKVATPPMETPRAISQVGRDELDKRAVNSYDESFRYRSGVQSAPYGSDNGVDWFNIRGFSGENSTYQDGLRLFRESGYFWWVTEPFGLERVDLLKGPSSILYGEAPPGGVVNAISKRPTEEKQGQFEIQGGNKDHRQVGIDTSGPVAGTDNMRYRMVGLFREGDGELDHTDNQRIYLAPSLAVDLSDDTSVTFLASYMKDHGTPSKGFRPVGGSLEGTEFGHIDRETNLGEPDYERQEREQISLGYELEHDIDDTWQFQQNLRYSSLDLLLRSVSPSTSLSNDNRTLDSRFLTYRDGSYDAFTVDNRLVGKWTTANTENTLLIGVDYQHLDIDYRTGDDYAFGNAPFDVFDPQYGNYTPFSDDDLVHHEDKKEQLGLYVQDQLRLGDRWVFLAGARHDQAEVENRTEGGDDEGYDDSQLSLSGGVMYLGDYGISPYLSYSESFTPHAGRDPDGQAYEPSEGEQWEAGVKYTPDWLDGYMTAAVFDLKETNTLYTSGDPVSSQGGERHSQGFELEGVGYLTEQLQLTASYTYLDTTIEDPERGEFRAGLTPRHQASLWLDYGFEGGALQGLDVGAGARYVGESVNAAPDRDDEVSSYTVYDAMASYEINSAWTAQVNVTNLTDKDYISGCDSWCYYGESRSVIGSLNYRW